ncbi:MAG: hypothetical protein JWQ25_175 [Daejeonella sp.]|nr:hypothetical protein [Daejeonella sp.]
MIEFTTEILKFAEQGEKTGWTYIEIPLDIAEQLKPNHRKAFRVKGYLDQLAIEGMALVPMGEGNFILALKADIRRALKKRRGDVLRVRLESHDDFEFVPPAGLMECLEEDLDSLEFFNSLTKSHREYFFKWIDSAKTEPTRIKRITKTVVAMSMKYGYAEMIRNLKHIE